MEQEIKLSKEILTKLNKLEEDVEMLKRREVIFEKQKITLIDESMVEIWDNKEDEIWNTY